MAAKILHSLTDDNPDLQKQIGCMNGIFQLFDRQLMLTGGRHVVGHTPRRLPPGNDQPGNGPLEREFSSSYQRSASPEKYLAKNMQDRQRVSTESSRASFSSSSRSSSFSSLDCNRATQLEPASFDRMIFPETPSRDPAMSLQSTSQFNRQSIDLKDLVKDSMYRETQGLSSKQKPVEEAKDSIGRYRDSPRSQSKNINCDLKEPLQSLPKLQEAPWYQNEPRELLRSLSYHSKDGSSFSVPRDAPRFSYDGREMNRAPFDSGDVPKSSMKFSDLPRLSLDSREGSMCSLNVDSKSNFLSRTHQNDNGEFDVKIQNQARPPSLVAKLMGLTALPDDVSSTNKNTSSSRSFQDGEFVNSSRSSDKPKASKPTQPLNLSSNLWKEPSSPSWRNPDSSMKPMSRFPIEPAPWKQSEGARGAQRPASRNARSPAKAQNTVSSVYSDIEKRLKDLKFTQSGKDLRALKQILEAMQDKGFLETEQEGQGPNYSNKKEHDREGLSSEHDTRSVNNRRLQTDHAFSSTRRVGSARKYDSPIVIMKPAKLVGKSGISAASVVQLDGLSGMPKFRGSELIDNRKSLNANSKQRDNAVNYVNTKDRTVKATQASTRSQYSSKDSSAGLVKNSGSISPRLQQKKLEMDRRARPPTPPESNKSKKPLNKLQSDSTSPGGRRRPKHLNPQPADEKLNDIEARGLESSSLVSDESIRRRSRSADVSPARSRSQSSSKVSEIEVPGSEEKNSGTSLSEEESAEFGYVPQEYPSPVSVLDNVAYTDYSRSPIKYSGKNLIVDASMDKVMNPDAVQGGAVNNFVPTSTDSGSSGINRQKLQNIESLIQKLQRLNSVHDEEQTDYIASLCENTNPDHRYISEILLASGLLLRDLGSSLSTFQFHPSGHPINPELFLVLEQTKASSLLKEEFSTEKAAQLVLKEKSHRKLVFDTVNEILARKLECSRPLKVVIKAINGQKLLKELCSEIEGLLPKNTKCSEEEDERWKNILCNDVMHLSGNWTNFDDEISDVIVLDVERLIFKDLVNEVVIGESNGVANKPGKRRQVVPK